MSDVTGTGVSGDLARVDLQPNFVSLIESVSSRAAIDQELRSRLEAVRELLVKEDPTPRPFLTVLLRTQGRRIEPLKDALLCLEAQTDQDFEVIVLEHNAAKAGAESVRAAISALPKDFAHRVRLIEVVGGSRSRPLNIGVESANGQYIAVFDDDDLVFAHWVEEFHKEAVPNKGRLLRAVVANQKVIPEEWAVAKQGFRVVSWPAAEYPAEFDQLQHLLVNYSPFMSWAFPRSLFFTYGLRFDEELLVCEDWDVILRGSLLCGVGEIPALTAIYRRWTGAESSYTSHSTESWQESEQRVIDRIDQNVFMMPVGSMNAIRRMVTYNTALDNYRFLFKGTTLRRPVHLVWTMAAPSVRFAVRVRNRLRRLRSR